jgi:hypothetical protein
MCERLVRARAWPYWTPGYRGGPAKRSPLAIERR